MAASSDDLSNAVATGLLTLAGVGLQLLLVHALRAEYRAPALATVSWLAGGSAMLVKDKRVSGPLAVTAGLGAVLAFDQLMTLYLGKRTLVRSMEPYQYIGLEDADDLGLEQRPPLG